jgi:hypothetical protein
LHSLAAEFWIELNWDELATELPDERELYEFVLGNVGFTYSFPYIAACY